MNRDICVEFLNGMIEHTVEARRHLETQDRALMEHAVRNIMQLANGLLFETNMAVNAIAGKTEVVVSVSSILPVG